MKHFRKENAIRVKMHKKDVGVIDQPCDPKADAPFTFEYSNDGYRSNDEDSDLDYILILDLRVT